MTAQTLDIGDPAKALRENSLADAFKGTRMEQILSTSPGPVSDRYLFSTDPIGVIVGPQGSAKSTTSLKKVLLEAMRIWPGPDGVRRYKVGIWRPYYENHWKATIPTWWKLFNRELFPEWTGSSPRSATHIIRIRDPFGDIVIEAQFLAYSDESDPEMLRGLEFTDALIPEFDTSEEEMVTWLIGRIGREPPRSIIMREGKIYGEMNAPDVTTWAYRDLYEEPKPGFVLYEQPGGLHPDAENIAIVGREYYEQQARLNAHRPWWVKRMIHNIPGMSRGVNLVYDSYDDERMHSKEPLPVLRELPVIVGLDNELSPAAVYCQETPDGQWRTLRSIALQGLPIEELGRRMLALEAKVFQDCEFYDVCDPAMLAGEDAAAAAGITTARSQRQRLEGVLGRKVHPARTNEPDARRAVINQKMALNLSGGRPGYICDPSNKGLRRGKLQTFHYRTVQGTDELGSIQKSFDSHVSEAEQYASLMSGTAQAQTRIGKLKAARERRMQEKRNAAPKRYNPISRRARG